MLHRMGIIRRLARGTAKVVGGSAALTTVGVAAYTSTEQGRGLRRELQFWQGVAPVVLDYYWNFASSSPYVKYQKFFLEEQYDDTNDDSSTAAVIRSGGSDNIKAKQQRRKEEKMQQLHHMHAPEILNVLLQLKGLYIKLGQVLSVTALPVPDAYRDQFRTLQSDVPGWEDFKTKVKPILEQELGKPVQDMFATIDPIPCGAASIGQAHRAVLVTNRNNDDDDDKKEEEVVIIKIQYPDAAWQIPADIQCVGDFLKLCVFFGVVDENAANLSFNEFSRQFIAELDYEQERRNLQDIYQSSLDPTAPYQRRNVVVPQVYPELCSSKVITMSYLPGPKLEEEARRQLEALGIDTKKGLRGLLRNEDKDDASSSSIIPTSKGSTTTTGNTMIQDTSPALATSPRRQDTSSEQQLGMKHWVVQMGGKLVSVDSVLGAIRLARRVQLWCTAATVKSIGVLSATPIAGTLLVPNSFQMWAEKHSTAAEQAKRLDLTKEWVDALFDVHAHQIFNLGCFNADAHPGNILVLDEDTDHPKLGLIDFGQCKRLTKQEQAQIARLLVSVANNESDETIASAFRVLGIQTKNDSTEFLSKFAKLMFGPLQSYHLDHSWHRELHKQDAVTYFPNQLSMVYRTSMLLRGLAISLQFNVSVGELWKIHAQEAIDRYETTIKDDTSTGLVPHNHKQEVRLVRRITTEEVIEDLQELALTSK